MESMIKDINLAPSGKQKIAWVKEYMPLLNILNEKYSKEQIFKGLNMVVTIHLEAKTAYLAQVLKNAGANVVVTGSNPLSTQDDVAAALVDSGVTVFATHACSAEEYDVYLREALKVEPDLIIDDGGDLVNMLHGERKDLIGKLIGGSEETTTGVHRLKALSKAGHLAFPMIAVNDAYCKYLFDNRYGTGQSSWDGIMRTTNMSVAGRTVVVAGYGWGGKGTAMRAKGLGARVIVTEIDPIKAIEAVMDGFTVMPMDEAAKRGDIFSAQGCTFTGLDYGIRCTPTGYTVMQHNVFIDCGVGYLLDCEGKNGGNANSTLGDNRFVGCDEGALGDRAGRAFCQR